MLESRKYGSQTFLEVVQNSCNPGFIELGDRLGKDRLFKYIRNFGFGQKPELTCKVKVVGFYLI